MNTPLGAPRGGASENRGVAFELFVFRMLEQDPEVELTAGSAPYGPSQVFDFAGRRNGKPLLVEVKQTTPQTAIRLMQIASQLKFAATEYAKLYPGEAPELILACAGVLSEPMRDRAAQLGLLLWDGPYLGSWALRLGVKVPPYIASGYPDAGIHADAVSQYAHSLISRLRSIRPGQRGWSSYEKYCEELLNFLFVPPLKPAIPQSRDYRKANRRDYILPNYALDGGFWEFMRNHYDAHYVVAEVKNLSSHPEKEDILQVANYLNRHGTGLFALVLARSELNKNAQWTCREQWIQHNKLIIGINDADVRQMVETKLAGGDPAELVREKIEDFRLGI
jgi:hypothetical protein